MMSEKMRAFFTEVNIWYKNSLKIQDKMQLPTGVVSKIGDLVLLLGQKTTSDIA